MDLYNINICLTFKYLDSMKMIFFMLLFVLGTSMIAGVYDNSDPPSEVTYSIDANFDFEAVVEYQTQPTVINQEVNVESGGLLEGTSFQRINQKIITPVITPNILTAMSNGLSFADLALRNKSDALQEGIFNVHKGKILG